MAGFWNHLEAGSLPCLAGDAGRSQEPPSGSASPTSALGLLCGCLGSPRLRSRILGEWHFGGLVLAVISTILFW